MTIMHIVTIEMDCVYGLKGFIYIAALPLVPGKYYLVAKVL